MSDDDPRPRFREHLHAMREALAGIGHDVSTDVKEAPRAAKEGTKNAFARAAGIRRTPIRAWSEADPPADEK
ncbi:MAG TPA: hypothetical protein VMG81_02970 [Thermoplasmata archaeon]|nr:hypothetical protein [Thermoplasmata archaeon]